MSKLVENQGERMVSLQNVLSVAQDSRITAANFLDEVSRLDTDDTLFPVLCASLATIDPTNMNVKIQVGVVLVMVELATSFECQAKGILSTFIPELSKLETWDETSD